MNRNLLLWGISMLVFALQAMCARGQGYEFAAVPDSVTAGVNFSAVADNTNVFVCVGAANSPVLSVNTNNFASFAAGNFGGGYLLASSAWTNTLNSPIKYNSLNCVAAQPDGFIASGATNAVYVSADGVNWTNWGHVLPAGDGGFTVDGIAYNPVSSTFSAALAVFVASWTTNPISTNVWQGATLLPPSSFAESFRAVTSFGSSNMALCGILGDIRISTDGGKSWFVSQQANSIMPNLLAVASDGGSNLVSAGASSLIEVSTNGGPNTTWTFQTNFNIGTPGSVTNFNAVAYNPTANAFLAAGTVGGNGLIVMAPKNGGSANWKWTGQTNLWTLKNGSLTQNANALAGITLNGAAFANTGFFQGIAMMVGNNGAIFIGGLPPPAPTNSAGNYVTNLLTNPQGNLALGDVGNIVADSNHPANVLAIDWYTAATGGIQLETNSPLFQPPGTLYNTCGVYTNWAAERDLRTGFSSTNRTPFVFYIVPGDPLNPVSVTNCDPVGQQFGMCATTPMSVTVVTNAENPPGTILVNWYDQNTNLMVTEFTSNSDIVTYAPTNLAPGVYTFYTQSTNPATGFVSPQWTILTNQINVLPAWTNSIVLSTIATLANPEVNPTFVAPSVTNLLDITLIEPGASVTNDWYTDFDPTVSTFENPGAPFVASGPTFTPSEQLCGVYRYYVRARVVDPNFTACACQSTNLIPVVFTLLPPAPIDAIVGLTNVLTGPVQTNAPIWVDVLTNASNPGGNFFLNWYSAATGGNNLNNSSDTSLGNRFFITPTNSVCGIFTNWAETEAIFTGAGGWQYSTNRTPVTFVIIPAAPASPVNETNCANITPPNPLAAVVPNSQVINWYDAPSGGTLLASGPAFSPTNTSPGVYTYWAEAQDTASGLVSTNRTAVVLQVNPLPLAPTNAVAQTSLLTVPYQTNATLTVSVDNSSFVGNPVTVDWYMDPAGFTHAYTATNAADPNWLSGGGVVEATNALIFIPTNRVCGTYTYYAQARVIDPATCNCLGCVSTNLTPVTFVLLPPAPIDAVVGLTNVLTGSVQINAPIWVDVLTNANNPATNFVVNWYSSPLGSNILNNSTDTNLSNRFFSTPTNSVCGIFTNWAETEAVITGSGASLASTNRVPVVFTIIPAAPTALGSVDVTNCIEVPNPTFTVAVTNGQTAVWDTVPSSGMPPIYSLSFTPTNSSVGTWTFSALAVDPNSGLSSTGAVTATLTLYSCTDSPAISMNAASGTETIQWPGNLTLLSATNLTPPVVWTSVATGSNFLAPNTLTITNTIPPVQFFRLTN